MVRLKGCAYQETSRFLLSSRRAGCPLKHLPLGFGCACFAVCIASTAELKGPVSDNPKKIWRTDRGTIFHKTLKPVGLLKAHGLSSSQLA